MSIFVCKKDSKVNIINNDYFKSMLFFPIFESKCIS